jgi:hypothetical protein
LKIPSGFLALRTGLRAGLDGLLLDWRGNSALRSGLRDLAALRGSPSTLSVSIKDGWVTHYGVEEGNANAIQVNDSPSGLHEVGKREV